MTTGLILSYRYPPPRNGTMVLFSSSVVPGTGRAVLANYTPAAPCLALLYTIRRATAEKLGELVKIGQNMLMTGSNIAYSSPLAGSRK